MLLYDGLLNKPTLFGLRGEGPRYSALQKGATDTVLLIGHADAQVMNDLHQVFDMQSAINFLGANSDSPLLRALLEAYSGGCKDIWIYPIAPMSEYEPVIANRLAEGNTFYATYKERLTEAYATLLDYDFYNIVVPVEAPFYDSGDVDFCGQLVDFCADSFAITGAISLGVLGTRVPSLDPSSTLTTNYNTTTIAEMTSDTRATLAGENGKFVLVVVGEGIFVHPQTTLSYNASFAVPTACLMAGCEYDRSIINKRLPGIISTTFMDFSEPQKRDLCKAKLNPVVKSERGRKGFSFEAKIITDNTLGQTGTDFWSMFQMRTAALVVNTIREMSWDYIGESHTEDLKRKVSSFLSDLVSKRYLRDYSLTFDSEKVLSSHHNPEFFDIVGPPRYKLVINVGIRPLIGIRAIYFSIEAGEIK